MCVPGLFSPPNLPSPPPIPAPPSARDITLTARQDAIREQQRREAGGGTILTGALGDVGFGQNVQRPSITGTALG